MRSNAVDWNACRALGGNKTDQTVNLRVDRVQIVVYLGVGNQIRSMSGADKLTIDVKLRGRVSCMCGIESNIDESVSKDVGKDGAPQGAILIEDFVDDIILGNLALVASNNSGSVVLDDACQGGGACDGGDPRRELAVPLGSGKFELGGVDERDA